jgi:uncharacterized RDD family membrane protein YckC
MAGKEPSYLGDGPGVVSEPSAAAETERGVAPAAVDAEESDGVVVSAPRPSRAGAPSFTVAGFWRRLAAAFVDAAIVVPVALLLWWIAASIGGVELPASRHHGLDFWLDLILTSDPSMWGAIGLTTAIGVIYLLLFHITMAQTPGMRVLKMRIIDIYGDPPSVVRSITRTLGYLASFATLSLGFLWVGFDSERRGLHDWMSGTYVVRI